MEGAAGAVVRSPAGVVAARGEQTALAEEGAQTAKSSRSGTC